MDTIELVEDAKDYMKELIYRGVSYEDALHSAAAEYSISWRIVETCYRESCE